MPVTRHFKKHFKVQFSGTEQHAGKRDAMRCNAGDTVVLRKFVNTVYGVLARSSNSSLKVTNT